jgi:hypothetical protein
MQTETTPERRASWKTWSEFLHRYGLENLAAWTLEAAGPLTVLGAQILYLGSPLFRPTFTNRQIDDLAGLFEERNEALAFAAFLKEELPS